MFKYTKESFNMLIEDCKKWAKVFKYVSLVATLGLLTYKIITGASTKDVFWFVNLGLAAAFIIFTFLDFLLDGLKLKDAKKITKKIYKWIKIVTKAATLTITIIEIKNATTFDGVQIILTTLMIILWVAQFASEIIVEVVTKRVNEILIAFNADVEDIKKPITAVSNTFKKITGKYVEPEVDVKKEKFLDKLRDRIKSKKADD